MADLITIGDLARRTGVATSTLRYYDELGLVRPTKRVSGRRRYTPDDVANVGVIRFFQEVGFTLAETKRLLSSRSRSPKTWRELAQRKVDELAQRIAKDEAARVAIEHSLACPKDDILECPNFWATVEEVLAGRPLAEAHKTR